MRIRYCDECQLPRSECDVQCPGYIEREYARKLTEWEMSSDWVDDPIY